MADLEATPKKIQELVETIENDSLSGATHLAHLAIEVYRRWLAAALALDLKQSRTSLKELSIRVARAQPAMASIFNLINRLLWTADEAISLENLREALILVIEDYERSMKRHQTALVKNALSVITGNQRIVTLSFSATVLSALKRAHDTGLRFEVVCPESRPRCEGIALAKELAAHGISCELVVDAVAPSYVETSDLVLVGGDGLTSSYLINKIGTYALALAAKWHHVPFVVLATTQKFFPNDFPIQLPIGNPAEIVNPTPANVRVIHSYFEKIPLSLVPTLLTEQGILDRRAIARAIKSIRTHPDLKENL
jgi:methylthioribose-1-phosphate isomerase